MVYLHLRESPNTDNEPLKTPTIRLQPIRWRCYHVVRFGIDRCTETASNSSKTCH